MFSLKMTIWLTAGIFCISSPVLAKSVNKTTRLRNLESLLKRQQATIDDLREKNLVLESKLTQERSKSVSPPVPFDPSAANTQESFSAGSHSANTASGTSLAQSWPATAEYLLFSKVLDSYQKNRHVELSRAVKLFLKAYPKSVYADNALFLRGKAEISNGEYQKALNTMNEVLRAYPTGNKYVSALFEKGVILRRMHRPALARAAFNEIKSRFGGSPESLQVAAEKSFAAGVVR